MADGAGLLHRHAVTARGLADFEAVFDGIDWPAGTADDLARCVAGCLPAAGGRRHKDLPIVELCHFIRALDDLFPVDDARNPDTRNPDTRDSLLLDLSAAPSASRFRGLFAGQAEAGGLRLVAGGVEIGYPDRPAFTVNFARMPFLQALYVFLVGAEGPVPAGAPEELALRSIYRPQLVAVLDEMCRRRTGAAVMVAVKAIAAHLRAWRARNLPGLNGERRLAPLARFLDEESPPGRWRIDDRVILRFWCRPDLQGDGSFAQYRTVVRAMLDLVDAMAERSVRAASLGARPLGTDRTAGEVDPADDEAAPLATAVPPLDLLAMEPAAAIRILTREERERLALPDRAGARAAELPLTMLRWLGFGAAQAAIETGRRVGIDAARLQAHIECREVPGHASGREQLQALDLVLCDLALLCLARQGGTVPPALAAMAEAAAQRSGRRLAALQRLADEAEAELALDLISDAVARLRPLTHALVAALAELGDLEACFAEDLPLFRARFAALYGAAA